MVWSKGNWMEIKSSRHQPRLLDMFLDATSANKFLSRKILYNHWDLELIVPDNLERECREEVCNYEEAREVFEDDSQTAEYGELDGLRWCDSKFFTTGSVGVVWLGGLVDVAWWAWQGKDTTKSPFLPHSWGKVTAKSHSLPTPLTCFPAPFSCPGQQKINNQSAGTPEAENRWGGASQRWYLPILQTT
uniref:Gla domain-containing protein n=1 Tax=Laticauda laticaudata TaxID=8630 RepID=A0A8C5SPT5_LATLA